MSRFSYTEDEKRRNVILAHQEKQCEKISRVFEESNIDVRIAESEKLLKELGMDLPKSKALAPKEKRVIHIRDYEDIYDEASADVGTEIILEDLFTPAEIKENALEVKELNHEYNSLHHLDKYDVIIAVAAGLLGAIVDIVLVGIPEKGPDGLEAGPLSDYIRKKFDEKFNPKEMEKLANSKESKVPFDAQDNRNTTEYVEGLSAYYHRMLSLGHDPILGFVFGVYDIMHGTMTTIDKKGKIVCQVMENYADRKETDIVSAVIKQIKHFESDITTSMGLPAPFMGLFNLLQFGNIGEEEQTIAEIVQGMYYEGFDFIHFCSQSTSTIVIELVTRIGYAVKRIKEGNRIKDSIPISLNREKHPKLATMLFISHCEASAINAGKVYFTKNPMAINYPEWIKFAKYLYKQLKWILVEKPEARNKYVTGAMDDELYRAIDQSNLLFEEYAMDCYVVFE